MTTRSIEWTELTWNPTTGYDKVSAGCKFCYAEIHVAAFAGDGVVSIKKRRVGSGKASITTHFQNRRSAIR